MDCVGCELHTLEALGHFLAALFSLHCEVWAGVLVVPGWLGRIGIYGGRRVYSIFSCGLSWSYLGHVIMCRSGVLRHLSMCIWRGLSWCALKPKIGCKSRYAINTYVCTAQTKAQERAGNRAEPNNSSALQRISNSRATQARSWVSDCGHNEKNLPPPRVGPLHVLSIRANTRKPMRCQAKPLRRMLMATCLTQQQPQVHSRNSPFLPAPVLTALRQSVLLLPMLLLLLLLLLLLQQGVVVLRGRGLQWGWVDAIGCWGVGQAAVLKQRAHEQAAKWGRGQGVGRQGVLQLRVLQISMLLGMCKMPLRRGGLYMKECRRGGEGRSKIHVRAE